MSWSLSPSMYVLLYVSQSEVVSIYSRSVVSVLIPVNAQLISVHAVIAGSVRLVAAVVDSSTTVPADSNLIICNTP